jgi:hypothetical protein
MTTRSADAIAAALVLALAATYWRAAAAIQDSLLSDAVGAGGYPKTIAALLGLCGLMLAIGAMRTPADDRPAAAFSLRPLGLVAILAAYVALFPVLGFPLSVAALVAAVAWYCGIPAGPRLAAVAIAAGLVFWLAFVKLMGVPFPVLPRWPA